MCASQHEDFLLRQVRAIAAMIARIVGLRLSGELVEARAELERAYRTLLGAREDVIPRVDPSTAAMLLGSSEAVLLYARLLREEAAQAEETRSRALLQRARDVAAAGAARDPGNDELRALIAEWDRASSP